MDAFEDLIDFIRNGDASQPMYRVDLDEKIRLAREAMEPPTCESCNSAAELCSDCADRECLSCSSSAKYCSEECARDANTPRTTRGKKIDVSKLAAK